ncbi:MAG TPA: winged helix DNA-binding domain-containing protein [Candidatus Dormibacteraeota bacterium]|nr:winged helix DNA-binding domain-containing protein [Candidatus Dormibacteraeota bacterium]
MSPDPIGRRALNRAVLARQLLLRRHRLSAVETVERLAGLQAQEPLDPYLALWTRLEGFRPEELAGLLTGRRVVRIALLRSTIHLVTVDDCLFMRPLVQLVIERMTMGTFGRRLVGLDAVAVTAAGRELVEDRPLTFSEIGSRLAERWPGHDGPSMAQAFRAWAPLVQVPPRGVWGSGGVARHTTLEAWLGRPLDPSPSPAELALRYLAAFGPASVMDLQAWSGLTRCREILDGLRPRLRTFRNERGAELFDLPDAPRPDPDTPAPVRFLPEYDIILLGHADRGRMARDEERGLVFGDAGRGWGWILVDGLARAVWRIERGREAATLVIRPFAPLSGAERNEVEEEGLRMLQFRDAGIGCRRVEFNSN